MTKYDSINYEGFVFTATNTLIPSERTFYKNVDFELGKLNLKVNPIGVNLNSDLEKSKFAKKYLLSDSLVVLNLWATWCKPCIEEMPEFKQLAANNKDTKFIFLSVDKDKEKLKEFLTKHRIADITFENADYRRAIQNFLEGRSTESLITTEIVPITYILKKGVVVHKETGGINKSSFEKILTTNKN